jgi:tetratricopeptide (TPR) repeat protein
MAQADDGSASTARRCAALLSHNAFASAHRACATGRATETRSRCELRYDGAVSSAAASDGSGDALHGIPALGAPRFVEVVRAMPAWQNPNLADALAQWTGARPGGSLRAALRLDDMERSAAYPRHSELRRRQNYNWATQRVARGAEHARKGATAEALKCYAQALKMAPNHADALVARGAAHANANELTRAVDDFERALRIEPSHANATEYLQRTRLKLGGVMAAARRRHAGATRMSTRPPVGAPMPPPMPRRVERRERDFVAVGPDAGAREVDEGSERAAKRVKKAAKKTKKKAKREAKKEKKRAKKAKKERRRQEE